MKAHALKIADGVYWTGVLDWDIRNYHGYTLSGTTYNSYLVFSSDKAVLIDNIPGHISPNGVGSGTPSNRKEGIKD